MAVNRHVADNFNTIEGVYEETRCIASDCMMWRWTNLPSQANPGSGYCGLAGESGANRS